MNTDQEIKRLRLELAAWKAEAKALRDTINHITALIDVNKRLVEILDRAVIPMTDVAKEFRPAPLQQTVYPLTHGTGTVFPHWPIGDTICSTSDAISKDSVEVKQPVPILTNKQSEFYHPTGVIP